MGKKSLSIEATYSICPAECTVLPALFGMHSSPKNCVSGLLRQTSCLIKGVVIANRTGGPAELGGSSQRKRMTFKRTIVSVLASEYFVKPMYLAFLLPTLGQEGLQQKTEGVAPSEVVFHPCLN